jgi:hypothetical protein
MQVGLRCVCVCAVSERLRGVDYMGWQVPAVDVSFRHVAGVNQRDDGAVSNVSLHARAWCQCYRSSVHARGAACVRVCAVSKRLRGVDSVGRQGLVLDASFRHVAGVNRPDDGAV